MFIHHVFFWLKEELPEDQILRFEKEVSTLLKIEHVQWGDVGKPASTDRRLIDRSYSYSLLLQFENEESHDLYQPHPVHQKFIEACSSLWNRVVIYDSETI